MLPIGGAKGSALALMVEILAAALTGSAFGGGGLFLVRRQGRAPNLGHVLIAIDPERLSGGSFMARMAALLTAMETDDEVRLPGLTRLTNRRAANEHGLTIPVKLYAEIKALAGA